MDLDYDREIVVKRVIKYCMSLKKCKKWVVCFFEELNDEIIVDEKFIKVFKIKVEFDVVDGWDVKKRMYLILDIIVDELVILKSIKECLLNLKRSGVFYKYVKVNKGFVVYGMVFFVFGVFDYFFRGDDVRGGFVVF